MKRILYLSEIGDSARDLPKAYMDALRRLGELNIVVSPSPLGVAERLALFRSHDIYLVGRASSPVPMELADAPGRLRLIAATVGSLRHIIAPAHLESGLRVVNWGDAPAFIMAEGALALLLAALKDIRPQIDHIASGGWHLDQTLHGGTIRGARIGLYGCGFIGAEFVRLLQPFKPAAIRVFDPYADQLPRGCERAPLLDELFERSDIISIHAGLSEETRGSVDARLLRRLPDGAVFINTARGGIVDQDALFAELAAGRLRAGLDVLEPDSLPSDHPARRWPNLVLSAHQIGRDWPAAYAGRNPADALTKAQRYVLGNIRRFCRNERLRWEIDEVRFSRMT